MIYVIKVDDKPIFATSLFVEFETKKSEMDSPYRVDFLKLSEADHRILLKECTKNLIELTTKKTLNMVDKS